MEPFTKTQKQDILFNKISDEICKDIIKNGQTFNLKTREDVISAVALLQQTYSQKLAGNPPAKDKRDSETTRINHNIRRRIVSGILAIGQIAMGKGTKQRTTQTRFLSRAQLSS
jgi:hypothetical protein